MLCVSQPTLGEEKIINGAVMLKRIKSEFFKKKIVTLKVFKNTQTNLNLS